MKQKIADLLNVIYGFRNVILWVALFLVSIIFRLKNYVDGGQWADLVKNTFLGLAAVHGTEHIISVVQSYVTMATQKGNAPQVAAEPAPQGDNLVEGDGK